MLNFNSVILSCHRYTSSVLKWDELGGDYNWGCQSTIFMEHFTLKSLVFILCSPTICSLMEIIYNVSLFAKVLQSSLSETF